ncbi:MAG: hypothetical protein DRP79_07555, partial [Planctomycetota bacterium]
MIDITRLLCGRLSEAESLRYSAADRQHPAPAVVVWNCTRRCNLRCLHCYSRSSDVHYPGELTGEEARAMIDDLADFGVRALLFSGGEPLLRKDLLDLGRHAARRGLRTVISTNGTLISRDMAAEIADASFKYVGVSLDGPEETNDRFRGRKGAFRQALDGIRNCRKAGLKVGVRFTLTRRNFADLGVMFDLVRREGIPRMCVYHLVYAGRGSELIGEDVERQQAREAMDVIFHRTRELARANGALEVLTVDNPADGVYLYLTIRREDPERAEDALRLLRLSGGSASGVRIGCVDNTGN